MSEDTKKERFYLLGFVSFPFRFVSLVLYLSTFLLGKSLSRLLSLILIPSFWAFSPSFGLLFVFVLYLSLRFPADDDETSWLF